VIGSGGREHAICHSFAKSPRVSRLYCAPGNPGIAQVAECVSLKSDDIAGLADFAIGEKIDLTFVGGEGPLALGIADEFEDRGLRIIGVSKAAARLEASKSFAKDFMSRHGIPTATFRTAPSANDAIDILESGHFGDEAARVVVKADGLAGGKGVIVARNRDEAITACNELSVLVGPDAAGTIVLEELLEGAEVSLIMFASGRDFALMPPVRDHKRIGEGDTGPNTGGMGTITDAGLLQPSETQEIINGIIEPTLAGCIEEGFPFRGILFLGLMMTAEGPKLLEYNVRFGDPETQSIIVRLESDIVDICEAILTGDLGETQIDWRAGNSACIVLAAEGYPQKPRIGDEIHGLADAAKLKNVTIFHAGTEERAEGQSGGDEIDDTSRDPADGSSSVIPHPPSFLTAGGRVIGVTASADSLDEALDKAYRAAEKISWRGMQYRRDIGR
jgi:phosphoribosylamine--glycine ligase